MNTKAAPQPLVSTPARIGGALAAIAIMFAGVSVAGHASTEAVDTAQAAMHPAVMYVKLQRVEVIGRSADAEVACAAPATRI